MTVKIVKNAEGYYIAKKRFLLFFWRRIRRYSWRFNWEVSFDSVTAEFMKANVLELYPEAKFIKDKN